MPKLESSAIPILVAAAVAGAVAYAVTQEPWKAARERVDAARLSLTANASPGGAAATVAAGTAAPQPRVIWVASAPGRVEPKSGETRIGAQAAARIVQVPVQVNNHVAAGDVMVRLDDQDLLIKHAAIEAEVAVRKRERDLETVQRGAADRRIAEDAVAAAERALFQARLDVDLIVDARRAGDASLAELTKVRENLSGWRERMDQERANLRKVQSQSGMPLPTRLESALASSRAELSLAESAIERTRIRAPFDGTVLQLNAKIGETAAPAGEPLVVFGDVSQLQVRAEVEERDVAKPRQGQRVIVRSDAYPGREFEGQVTLLAHSLGAPRLANRGPRRPSDVDVLEVVITLDGQPPLLPGMRVDVFFKPDATVQSRDGDQTN